MKRRILANELTNFRSLSTLSIVALVNMEDLLLPTFRAFAAAIVAKVTNTQDPYLLMIPETLAPTDEAERELLNQLSARSNCLIFYLSSHSVDGMFML